MNRKQIRKETKKEDLILIAKISELTNIDEKKLIELFCSQPEYLKDKSRRLMREDIESINAGKLEIVKG